MNNEKGKNNNAVIAVLVVIIVILGILCVLFATNTISFNSKVVNDNSKLSNENNSNLEEEENNSLVKEKVNSKWIDYLLSCHILEAKLTRVRSKDLGDNEDFNKTVTISLDDLKNILSKIRNSDLLKTYSLGRGGPDSDHLSVSYEYNEQIYKFEIYYGSIAVDNLDNGLKTILENNNYNEKNTEYKNSDSSFYFYSIEDYSSSIFDEYFQ